MPEGLPKVLPEVPVGLLAQLLERIGPAQLVHALETDERRQSVIALDLSQKSSKNKRRQKTNADLTWTAAIPASISAMTTACPVDSSARKTERISGFSARQVLHILLTSKRFGSLFASMAFRRRKPRGFVNNTQNLGGRWSVQLVDCDEGVRQSGRRVEDVTVHCVLRIYGPIFYTTLLSRRRAAA